MKFFLNGFCILITLCSFGQGNVGIGFVSPSERLQVDSAIKIGNLAWNPSLNNSRYLKFGDGGYVTIGENGLDDRLEFSAREFLFRNSGGYGSNQGRVGININATPAAFLEINATGGIPALKITDGTQATGKVLMSMDANGNASWQAPVNQNSGFLAYAPGVVGYASSSSSFYRVDFTTEAYDDGNNFSTAPSTFYFLAPASGVYHFDVDLFWQLTTVANPYYIVMQLGNGISTIHELFTQIPGNASNFTTTHMSVDVKLTNGQTVGLYVSQNSGAEQKINGGYTRFTGHRIY